MAEPKTKSKAANERKDIDIKYSDLLSLWRVQESLLQAYRAMFIGAQSIFISIASIITQNKDAFFPLGAMTFLGLATLYMWHSICRPRGKAVYLIQSFVLKAEKGEKIYNPLTKLKNFQDSPNSSGGEDTQYRALKGGATRNKMEVYLPLIFFLAWVFLWIIAFLNFYNIELIEK